MTEPIALQLAVCVDGVEVTREGIERWPDDAFKAAAAGLLERRKNGLSWYVPEGQYPPRGPVIAAARLKRADPDALVTVCAWVQEEVAICGEAGHGYYDPAEGCPDCAREGA